MMDVNGCLNSMHFFSLDLVDVSVQCSGFFQRSFLIFLAPKEMTRFPIAALRIFSGTRRGRSHFLNHLFFKNGILSKGILFFKTSSMFLSSSLLLV